MAVAASAQLREIAVKLREAGHGGLVTEMSRALRTAAAPLIPAVQDAARRQLPKGGGLNEQVASQRVTVSVTKGARSAGVQLVTRAPDTGMTDAGFVRHPTFGRRGEGQWKTQQIPEAAGWWSKTLAEKTPEVGAELLRTLTHYQSYIQGRR